jgi:F-type H+-transporting ATPase subunit a
MPEHELWLTKVFNQYLGGAANSILSAVHVTPDDPAHPWQNWLVMEILVVVLLVALFAVLRPRLSVDKPGKTQHIFEVLYGFFKTSVEEAGIDHGEKYLPYFGAIFIFILAMNLIGIIPAFESPTMSPAVTLGLALCTFIYYNAWGFRTHGAKYLLQLMGPVWWLAPLMVLIEIASHLARPLSLTLRLYANMLAGEQVTGAFLALSKVVIPAVFMGLHLFVALLQAYIFMLLSMVYVRGAVSHDH